MKFRLLIISALIAFYSCDRATRDLGEIKSMQREIDSLWMIEVSDSLRPTTSYYMRNFAVTQSGQTIRLDNLKIENWPEGILSFHDILYTEYGRPVAAQDAILGHGESCLSRHYFNHKGETISRLIANWFYDDSTKLLVDDRKIAFYDADFQTLEIDSILHDDKGAKILIQVQEPNLDGKVLPSYKAFEEFVSSNKIEL